MERGSGEGRLVLTERDREIKYGDGWVQEREGGGGGYSSQPLTK